MPGFVQLVHGIPSLHHLSVTHSFIHSSVTLSSLCGFASFRGQREELDFIPDIQHSAHGGDQPVKVGGDMASETQAHWGFHEGS